MKFDAYLKVNHNKAGTIEAVDEPDARKQWKYLGYDSDIYYYYPSDSTIVDNKLLDNQDQMVKNFDKDSGYIPFPDGKPMINEDEIVVDQFGTTVGDIKKNELGQLNYKDEYTKEYEAKTAKYNVGGAIRHDQDKPHMDLLSPIAMFGLAQVLTKGLEKYPGSQWKKGMAWSRVIASLLRHTFKFMSGEDYDEDTKLPHVDHMAANITFLQEYFRKHKNLDDRMKTGLE